MASKLCCTIEQEGRPDSPELPNARRSDATPAKLPLLPKRPDSQGSRFTSARSEDLHELRQIFNSAKDSEDSKHSSRTKSHRSPFARPSMYSLHSLHKMKSLHALIKRKFSRDLSRTKSNTQLRESSPKKEHMIEEPDTVVKVPRDGPNLQLKITKDDLRKDLLSDKKPEEGGYDPDAEMLDDIARNIGKKPPSKRPSIHSIDWTSSPGSKQTPGSSSKGRRSSDLGYDSQPYQIKQPQSTGNTPMSARFSQFISSPNLQVNPPKVKDQRLRRSHSTTSIDVPVPSPVSPRLPSMTINDPDAVPWSISMVESLRLSQFPTPPRHLSSEPSKSSLYVNFGSAETGNKQPSLELEASKETAKLCGPIPDDKADDLQIQVQQPTLPCVSGSIHDSVRKNTPPVKEAINKSHDEDEEDDPRRSVHLYSMRISHHLRSGSLLSWENLADPLDKSSPTRPFRDRTPSNQSRVSKLQQLSGRTRYERQSSSSGFASSRVPSKWGKVLPQDRDHREEKSSIYSSRPQSPPDSFGGSLINLSRSFTYLDPLNPTTSDLPQRRLSDSYPATDNEETPRPLHRYGITNTQDALSTTPKNPLLKSLIPLARNNSVANTKQSKFREEFSPSPPRKKTSASIMKFLNPKRSSIRSQSETNIKAENFGVDGPIAQPHAATNRERRLSRSMMSLQTEQEAVGKEKASNPMWERALRAHQEERSSMFLPQNKELATQGTPFRERRGSAVKPRASLNEEVSPPTQAVTVPKPPPFLEAQAPDQGGLDFIPSLFKRRSAVISRDKDNVSPGQEAKVAFDKQTDDVKTVGAWGRYPSHTRPERTNSASHLDDVQARDFALENAMKFAMGVDADDEIDPTTRPESPSPINGKKRKKRVGSGHIAKSNSMTFGKQFFKNYTRIFRSQSTEFQRHGHGHRSSITTGGMLEYPELEILPDVWRRGIIEERRKDGSNESQEPDGGGEGSRGRDKKGKGKSGADDSMATLCPKNNEDDSSITLDGAAETQTETPTDRARVWSVYYEDCVPNFPRASLDLAAHSRAHYQDLELLEFGRMSARHSFDLSRHSTTLPARLTKHSRHGSRIGRLSIISHSSAKPSLASMGRGEDGEGDGADERSMVSVRRSTMDLITLYREQETVERERVLSLMRMESVKGETAGVMAV
ncbi:hypothetical protein K505DRAFT_347907 [Melanomma pulvis-pyrius CBS 109.77]|uniref:Uncharacterized protein n=1 Tax=Melanomma pulvis-pyrius CBS 109.77 TaxID=1314802 RepID=A0A6A6XJ30_9PLEO|nr:hypothetical protein K505DRAFT_347907 [Melanomma pulvis-pyrius CBS 109.77]